MMAAAAQEEFPLVRLPSRRLVLTRTVTLPRRCIVEAEGRSFIHGATRDFDLFAFENPLGIDVEFFGIGFNGGRRVFAAEGHGNILVRNCLSYDNEGFWVTRTGDAPLHLEIVDSTFYNPVLAVGTRADMRIFDCWSSIQVTLEKASHIVNDRGTLLVQNLLGVPVIFADWEAYPNWRYGHDIFWIKNMDGVVRTRDVRYGGEFGGIPIVDNFGKGRFMIEGQMVFFYAPSCAKAVFRNRSAEATAVIRQMSSFFDCVPGCLFCDGVLPENLSAVGCLMPTGFTVRPFPQEAEAQP